jgi:hypothetical protein
MQMLKRFIILCLPFVVTACSQQLTLDPVGEEVLEETAVRTPLSAVTPSSRLLAAGTKSVTFTVTTQDPSIVKADTSNKSFSSMTKIATSTNNNRTHSFTFSLQTNKPYSFYIKAAPTNNLSKPYSVTRRVNYRVVTAYRPTYPRIFTLWWPVWGQWQDVTAEKLSKLSVFIHNFHGYNTLDPFEPIDEAVFNRARELNPNLRILTQLYSTYGCDTSYCDELERIDRDPKHPLYKKVFIRKADGSYWTYGAGEPWEHKVYNFANAPTVNFLLQKNLKLWRTDLLVFDGAFMDNCWRGFSGVADSRGFGIGNTIDLDLDGVADDPLQRDTAYEYGLQDFLRGLRAEMPDAMLLCNATGGFPNKKSLHDERQPLTDRNGQPFSYSNFINGNMFEDHMFTLARGDYWRSYVDLMNEYKAWNAANPPGTMLPNPISNYTGEDPYDSLREMRFGLAFTLMGDGLFLHGGWSQHTTFDEYKANLGYPTQSFGAPIASGSPVWSRRFDNGLILVNTSATQAVTVNLNGTYKAIQGAQDSTINNGKTLTKVTIPPLDGRILLKP